MVLYISHSRRSYGVCIGERDDGMMTKCWSYSNSNSRLIQPTIIEILGSQF